MGGAKATSETLGVPRGAPYRWLKTGVIKSTHLGLIKRHFPKISIDKFFKQD